jgi:hypothetical protein
MQQALIVLPQLLRQTQRFVRVTQVLLGLLHPEPRCTERSSDVAELHDAHGQAAFLPTLHWGPAGRD